MQGTLLGRHGFTLGHRAQLGHSLLCCVPRSVLTREALTAPAHESVPLPKHIICFLFTHALPHPTYAPQDSHIDLFKIDWNLSSLLHTV